MPVKGNRAAALPQRSGFTLVELLVVITIIAVLAALITPAVFQARVTTQNAAIKAEIDMLHMAMMNYKNEYGSFPPCFSVASASSPAATHVNRLFPRSNGAGNGSVRSPENALVRWLRGYSSNPTDPVGDGRKKDVRLR
jgi:prepilin-type N-terminal cleavage/methylation domain-containing protein